MDLSKIGNFQEFGSLPAVPTTYAQGVGMGTSFAPIWTNEPRPPTPFTPSAKVNAAPFTGYYKIVAGNGYVYLQSGYVFTDLSTGGQFFLGGQQAQLAPSGNDIVWLQCDITAGVLTSVTLCTNTSVSGGFDTSKSAWDAGGKSYVSKDAVTNYQTDAKILIANYNPHNNPAFYPIVTTNLVMMNMCINGYPAIYPIPY